MPVTLIDHMGSDLTVVNAARVSMHKQAKQFSEKDERLINYLATHGHWTPFSHVVLQFRIEMPIFISRQWFKHTVGFTRNEMSRRYVSENPTFWEPGSWREKADNVKQGSGGDLPAKNQMVLDRLYTDSMKGAAAMYQLFLDSGVCPEQARSLLPQAMMTEFVETASLYAYARLVKLRLEPNAQAEIQRYAGVISDACYSVAPVSWKALMGADWEGEPANISVQEEAAA